jgi:hypothetical protein
MHRIAFSLAVLAFLLNPGIACSPSDEDAQFEYGEAEMRAAVEGTWELGLLAGDGTRSTLSLRIVEATEKKDGSALLRPDKLRGLIRSAAACGSQSFVKPAGACISESTMPIEVAYLSGDQRFQNVAMSGLFIIPSEKLIPGRLELQLGDMRANATVTPQGIASDPFTSAPDGTTLVSLTRTSTGG